MRPLIVVGKGKLAQSIIASFDCRHCGPVMAWEDFDQGSDLPVWLVHVGSGRQLAESRAFCTRTQSPLLELATGSILDEGQTDFPLFILPNTALLLVKCMVMLGSMGHLFKNYQIELTESHQASKKSVPGTAVALANALGLDTIVTVRDVAGQKALGIPAEHLALHAYHKIRITDTDSYMQIETRIDGHGPYVKGLAELIGMLAPHVDTFKAKTYTLMDVLGFQ